MTRSDYLHDRGMVVSVQEAEAELKSKRPLVPVCLIVYSFYTEAVLCLSDMDVATANGIQSVSKTWFLMDIEEIINDFPEYAHNIQHNRRGK